MKRTVFYLFLSILITSFAFSAPELNTPERKTVSGTLEPVELNEPAFEPRKLHEIEKEKTSITVETDISGVEVFLNGVYQGRTNLIISDLLPGYYHLELRKPGYETERFIVRVRRGYELEYYVKMRRIFGTIRLRNVPAEASVYVAGAFSTQWNYGNGERNCRIEVEPGSHEVTIKKFGYETYSQWINVHAYETTVVDVEMKEAAFSLSDFKAEKDSFNPEYNGRLGKCEFSFYVTASSPAEVEIKDFCDYVVWKKTYNSFSTWNQSFYWEGKDEKGNLLPDGEYYVTIKASGLEESAVVSLDRSINYPVLSATAVGGGVGSLPMAFTEYSNFVLLNISGGMNYVESIAGELNAHFLFNFGKHFEIGAGTSTFYDGYNNPAQFSGSFKLYDSIPVTGGEFCVGGLIRYGMTTERLYDAYSIDCGNGLGCGLLTGYDIGDFYFGFASQFVAGAGNGRVKFDDCIWNNGAAVSFLPRPSLKISAWSAVNSAFGNNTDWLRAIDAGVEMNVMPESAGFIITGKGEVKIINNYGNVYSAGIGLSYLF